jgi:hypothetical protein
LRPEIFSSVRDLLYLAGFLTGFALGFFICSRKKRRSRAQKEWRVTAGIFAMSAALLIIGGVFVLSGGMVIYDYSLLTAACCAAVIGFFAVLFPGIVLFPALILSGVYIALAGYLFLRHPRQGGDITVAKITPDSGGGFVIEAEYPEQRLTKYKTYGSVNSAPLPVGSRSFRLEYTIALVTPNRLIPLAGGQRRYIPAALYLVDSNFMHIRLYRQTFLEEAFTNVLFRYNGPLITARRLLTRTELTGMSPRTNHIIQFDGVTLQKKSG